MRSQYLVLGLVLVNLTATTEAQQTPEPATPTAVAPAVVAPATVAPAIAPEIQAQGELKLSLIIVDELTPKPVPLTYFKITNTVDNSFQMVKTDAMGCIDLHLTPGAYLIAIGRPLLFKGHSYLWSGKAAIMANQVLKIDWTDADSAATEVKMGRQISDEALVYKQRKSGVVTVEGDFGSGSGFVVDARGLILTNQHVINGGRWAAVRFERGIRVPAIVVEEDKAADVAVLCINPATYKDFSVVPLATGADGDLAVEGEKVLTIGSPLNQEKILTIGIISKVEKDFLISDVNINHGNSGGPLLNMAGDAIGLTTFLDANEPSGPGISGIVSITKAFPALQRARENLSRVRLPVAERLPDISTVPIPEPSLTAYNSKSARPYEMGKPKNFETIIATPFFIAAAQAEAEAFLSKDRERRIKKRGKSGVTEELNASPSKFWQRYALHSADPVVWVIVRPTLKEKSSSIWSSVLGAIANVPSQRKLEYRDDFWDMALYRGDTLVHPVRRVRDVASALYEDYDVAVKDAAYGGIYFYDPSAFAPGAEMKLYTRRESDLDRWDVVKLDSKEIARIYAMFLPYRAALVQAGGTDAIQGLSASIHTPPAAGAEWTSESQEAANRLSTSVTPTGGDMATTRTTPRLRLSGLPCRVYVEMKDGMSYIGKAASSGNDYYTLETSAGTVKISASELAKVEYLK